MKTQLPISDGWFGEKITKTVDGLVRAVSTMYLVADKEVRQVLAEDLHHALFQAMKIASVGLDNPVLFSPARVEAVWGNPDLLKEWLLDAGQSVRLGESITAQSKRRVSDAKRWAAGERPHRLTNPGEGT